MDSSNNLLLKDLWGVLSYFLKDFNFLNLTPLIICSTGLILFAIKLWIIFLGTWDDMKKLRVPNKLKWLFWIFLFPGRGFSLYMMTIRRAIINVTRQPQNTLISNHSNNNMADFSASLSGADSLHNNSTLLSSKFKLLR